MNRWNPILGSRCWIVAEIGVNHNGDPSAATELIRAAAFAGANAVKFQTFSTHSLVRKDTQLSHYTKMLQALELPPSAWKTLKSEAESLGMFFFSTPFDLESAQLLDSLGVSVFKVSSGDITHHGLLSELARLKKPILLSTGTASFDEIQSAVDVLETCQMKDIAILHCVSLYPTPISEVNLKVMTRLGNIYPYPVGFSDHTEGIEAPLAAVALGARIIEKHFTLDRTQKGPDHGFSLDPRLFQSLVQGIRRVEAALGHEEKTIGIDEKKISRLVRRSFVVAKEKTQGSRLGPEDFLALRPGDGIAANTNIAQRTLLRSVQAGELLKPEDLSPP